MPSEIMLGGQTISACSPVYIIAEIGINHNGDIAIAKKLIDIASQAGCNAVKFQKRTPELCVPESHHHLPKKTPWGTMTYMEYRRRMEFSYTEYEEINHYCHLNKINWFASCWDIPSVDFIDKFNPICFKVASACLTDDQLLHHLNSKQKPVILSTGMSTMDEIHHAVSILNNDMLLIAHTTSSYPCAVEELNLKMIQTIQNKFGCLTGYSGHEKGIALTAVPVTLGARFIERHITLDKHLWGSDQKASLTPDELKSMVEMIRFVEQSLGNGIKKVYSSEKPIKAKLRKYKN